MSNGGISRQELSNELNEELSMIKNIEFEGSTYEPIIVNHPFKEVNSSTLTTGSGSVTQIAVDDNFIYIASSTSNSVTILDKETLSETGYYLENGAVSYCVATDNGKVYVTGGNSASRVVVKEFTVPTSLSSSSQSIAHNRVSDILPGSTSLRAMAVDDNYIYVGSIQNTGIGRVDKATFTMTVSASLFYTATSVASDGIHVYVGTSNGMLYKLRVSDLVQVASINIGTFLSSLTVDNGIIYVGYASGQISKFYTSNLTQLPERANYGGRLTCLTIDGDFLYATGATHSNIKKYNKNTLAFLSSTETPLETEQMPHSVIINDGYAYHVEAYKSDPTNNIWRWVIKKYAIDKGEILYQKVVQ